MKMKNIRKRRRKLEEEAEEGKKLEKILVSIPVKK
jgi:hypothetical protein